MVIRLMVLYGIMGTLHNIPLVLYSGVECCSAPHVGVQFWGGSGWFSLF